MAFAFALAVVSCSHPASLRDKLNGTWQSDLGTVSFDFDKGTYSGVAFGETFHQDLKFVSENANVLTFESRNRTFVVQFQENGSIMVTRQAAPNEEASFPMILKRATP